MVGDRITDVIAAARVGCRSVLVRSGRPDSLPIVTVDPIDPQIQPDHSCADLAEAAEWILSQQ
jgi:D-glycero-D-manno-heptose 1,7-bisphosphate phosphatase